MPPNALQRTRRGHRGCNRCFPCAGSLSLFRCEMKLHSILIGWNKILTNPCVSPQVFHGGTRLTGCGRVAATVQGVKPSRQCSKPGSLQPGKGWNRRTRPNHSRPHRSGLAWQERMWNQLEPGNPNDERCPSLGASRACHRMERRINGHRRVLPNCPRGLGCFGRCIATIEQWNAPARGSS